MVAGELYDPRDPELTRRRLHARELMSDFNTSRATEADRREALLSALLGSVGPSVEIEPPFFCDYGSNIHLGERVFLNFNCVVLDVAEVRIGARTLIGPAVQMYTATHPLDVETRRTHELARPIEIGEDVWIGGGAIILPGVRVGSRSVIGAGSVVTRDIPEGVLAAGNPCRVIRSLP